MSNQWGIPKEVDNFIRERNSECVYCRTEFKKEDSLQASKSKSLKTSFSTFLIGLLWLICGFACFGQNFTKSESVSTEEIIQLFNGKNLTGWYTFLQDRGRDNDPKKVFTVENGMIRISGEEWGCITTHDEYENYKLTVEFKWGDETYAPREQNARDSGILLHSQGEDGGSQGIWMNSIECQVIEGGTGDFIVVGDGSDQFQITSTVSPEKQGWAYIYNPEGEPQTIKEGRINWLKRDPDWKDELGFRGKNDVEKPAGEWNRLEIICYEDQITIYLNDELVNQATKVKPQKGRIQIQSEGAEIFFRKVDLQPVSDSK